MIQLNNRVYDIIKWVALIAIPALVTFLSVVLGALGVDPHVINVVTTILSAIGTFIGTLIGVSTANYNKTQDKDESNLQ